MEFYTLDQTHTQYLAPFKDLYEQAFPAQEKKPFALMEKLVKLGKMELLALVEDGEFIGLSAHMLTQNTALLDYLAIHPDKRGGGWGGKAVALILERFAGKKLILEIEKPDPTADNALERSRRKAFYLRNGIRETGLFANVYQTDFEILANVEQVSYEEYLDLLIAVLGEDLVRRLNPHRI